MLAMVSKLPEGSPWVARVENPISQSFCQRGHHNTKGRSPTVKKQLDSETALGWGVVQDLLWAPWNHQSCRWVKTTPSTRVDKPNLGGTTLSLLPALQPAPCMLPTLATNPSPIPEHAMDEPTWGPRSYCSSPP